jgi:hypothetical protein
MNEKNTLREQFFKLESEVTKMIKIYDARIEKLQEENRKLREIILNQKHR